MESLQAMVHESDGGHKLTRQRLSAEVAWLQQAFSVVAPFTKQRHSASFFYFLFLLDNFPSAAG